MRAAVAQQATCTQDLPRRFVAPFEQEVERNGFAGGDSVEHGEVGGGEESQVVAVLPVDALEVFGHDEPDARRFLGERARLARRALAVALARDDHHESAVLDRIATDRLLVAGLEANVGYAAQT